MLSEDRGPVLEAIISRFVLYIVICLFMLIMYCRMRTMRQSSPSRFVAVSATIPNTADIAQWLSHREGGAPATVCRFGPEYRPVPLELHVVGVPWTGNSSNPFMFDHALNYRCACNYVMLLLMGRIG